MMIAAAPATSPVIHPTSQMGGHRRRIPDRLCFQGIPVRLVTGCSWVSAEHVLGGAVSDTTLRAGAVAAPVVTSVRFDLEEGSSEEAVVNWFRDVEFPDAASRSGFLAARLLYRTGRPHHANPWLSSWATLVEWEDQASAEAAGGEGDALERLAGSGLGVTGAAFHLAVRVLSVMTG